MSEIALALQRPSGFALGVDVALPDAGITALFGASGSGKSTLLRCVAGLERARGKVRIAGDTWQDDTAGVFLAPWKRPLGYVFQEASLFDHLDVRGNLAYAQRRAGRTAAIALDAVIDLLGIGALLDRRTHQLSGGERQRVAIARALATQPRLLLLDEPLAAVDLSRRREILPWLEKLRDELRVPMLYVSHAMDEVARLADHLVVLEGGRVLASGGLAETLARLDLPLAQDEEAGALVAATVAERDGRWHLARAEFEGGSLWFKDPGLPVGRPVRLRVLARDVSLAPQRPGRSSIQNLLDCRVEALAPGTHPSQVMVRLRCGHSFLLARITGRAADELGLAAGHRLWAQVKAVGVAG
jgi:molybdate transport system ATP-binding protein